MEENCERMEEDVCDTSEYPKDFTANLRLHRAARKGNVRKLRRLCKSGINPDAVNEQCQSPLFVAALHNREKAVQFLLESGANPNHACYDGSTPMHAACLSCSPTILCLLADAGGNVNHHDNRGLLPRDWISYQEEVDKRFKMRKFLEAMRLYAVGTIGDETLSRRTRTRWNEFMDSLRQFQEHRRRQWRRRRWFTASLHRGFRPRIPESVTNFFQRFHNIDWTPCFRLYPRQEVDITERDTLRSRDVLKVQRETEEGDADICKRQLSDSTYPVLTLYVDEKEGKLTSTRKKEDILQIDLVEIEEERGSQGSDGLLQRTGTGDGGRVENKEGAEILAGADDLQNGNARATGDMTGDRTKQLLPKVDRNSAEHMEDTQGKLGQAASDTQQDERSSTTSSDDSCKNRMMEILEDAFKLELAPKVSDLMAEYCDSTQGSNVAQESLDIDFHSYHGDDADDQVDVDSVKYLGQENVSHGERNSAHPEAEEAEDHFDDERDGFGTTEMEIDNLLPKDDVADCDASDEEDCNFIKEGRYIDVQKMLSANMEMVFPETAPGLPCDLNNNEEKRESQKDGDDTAGSSIYQVSALNDAAFMSDLSLEVNVNESLKSSLNSVLQPPDTEDGDKRRSKDGDEDEDDGMENAPLRSALAKLDLTQAEKQEVQEWFGGHGSVHNLILNYESKIQEIQCETLRSNVTSLSALLRREYAMMDQGRVRDARRCVSDTAALHQSHLMQPRMTSSECPRVMPATSVQTASDDKDPDDSWLWPASGEENETFEEQLRRSMETIGMDDDDDGKEEEEEDDGREDGEKQGDSGRGDADEAPLDLKRLVSPPPPACTPEEHSPRPTLDNAEDTSVPSQVNHSGDCETADLVQATDDAAGPIYKSLTPPFTSAPTSPRAEAELTPQFSPPSLADKKLMKIAVMRSPTVEAIQNTSD